VAVLTDAMDSISAFEIIKIGIGPSSSHTMGPWTAAGMFLGVLQKDEGLASVETIQIHLYGSLALTGMGHGTDLAILLGLSGEDYTTIDPSEISGKYEGIRESGELLLGGSHQVTFSYKKDLIFHKRKRLPRHPNGMEFVATLASGKEISEEYYSVGGGFVLTGSEGVVNQKLASAPYACHDAKSIETYCEELGLSVSQLVRRNEQTWRNEGAIEESALQIWSEIIQCIYRGINQSGKLPGSLSVKRRAKELNESLMGDAAYDNCEEWLDLLASFDRGFTSVSKWVTCFALAVSEENASFGRVVTAPTNGASGVIPAVLMYAYCFEDFSEEQIVDFILVAGEVGTLFKKNATISGAMGGCQAEIGVSSAMAAAALTACRKGSPGQVLMAAEIAMEHHLGLTCDPIGGLVQIPCIERNSMGAIKAITASNIAMESDPSSAKVRLDDVISTMWSTAKDMNSKYKETSKGGLAANVSVSNVEC